MKDVLKFYDTWHEEVTSAEGKSDHFISGTTFHILETTSWHPWFMRENIENFRLIVGFLHSFTSNRSSRMSLLIQVSHSRILEDLAIGVSFIVTDDDNQVDKKTRTCYFDCWVHLESSERGTLQQLQAIGRPGGTLVASKEWRRLRDFKHLQIIECKVWSISPFLSTYISESPMLKHLT